MKHALTLTLLLALAAPAAAEPITVRVIEVAGGTAYVTPGRAAGLVPGTKVRMHGRELVVIEATEKTAALRADGPVEVGETGSANVDRTAATTVKMLPKPHPQDAFREQWPAPVLPAETQNPKSVPLGAGRTATGAAHVTVIGHAYGVAQQNHAAGEGEARVIASFDLLQDRPLAADADLAVRGFSGGYNSGTHTPLFVRAAQLRYGPSYDPTLAIGRLRFAASSVGMLDGGRAAVHLGTLEIAAFGGIVPDPVSGKPTTDASRFGTELVYDAAKLAWQPRVAVVAQGSTWMGQLDERRLSVVASANRASTWLDAWAEAQQFPSDNPWGAQSVELTGAGGTAEWRSHGTHLGLDMTFMRPERSLRLAAALPPDWLCTTEPRAGTTPAPCASGDYWTSASASAGLRGKRWALDAVGTFGESHGVYRGYDSSGYLHGELFFGTTRLVAGGSGGHASFASWMAGELGLGAALARRIDAVITYRPELLDYRAGTGPDLIHEVVADGHYALSPALDLAGSAVATVGADRNALAVLATFVWRPLP